MPKQSGFTLLELMVVLAVIAAVSMVTFLSASPTIQPRSLVIESDLVASNMLALINRAKATQSSAIITCGSNYILADYYLGVRSNITVVSASKKVGLAVSSQAFNKTKTQEYILPEARNVSVQCPSCGELFVSSDGNLLSSWRCNSMDFTLKKSASPDVEVRVSISNLGFPRVFARSTKIGLAWNEIQR